MECTQRLKCTQEFASQSERLYPDQIGILEICGTKYPVKKGPNKIGRDPQTCHIVVDKHFKFNPYSQKPKKKATISKHHAVLNILPDKDFTLMDLDSAYKTKLCGKTLQAYIPYPIKNGDIVQLGQVFGVFRLLEEENDLQMTQAIDIPEMTVAHRHASKIHHAPSTTIPESRDVSDKDDSFTKPSDVIHEMETQVPTNQDKCNSNHELSNQNDDIHEMETQEPFSNNRNEDTDSIYTAEIQFLTEDNTSPLIHSLETQLPYVDKIDKQIEEQDSQRYYYSTNKENDISFYNAEKNFDAHAQPMLPLDTPLGEIKENSVNQDNETVKENTPATRNVRITSDSSIDCDDFIVPTQKTPKKLRREDLTDCEDEPEETEPKVTKHDDDVNTQNCIDEDDFEIMPTQKLSEKQRIEEDPKESNFEDMATQVLKEVTGKTAAKNVLITSAINENTNFDDMLTQVLVEEIAERDPGFKDLPTQVLNDDDGNAVSVKSSSEQVFSEEIIKPLQTPINGKKKDSLKKNDSINNLKQKAEEDEKYYAATQDLLEDLCTQREMSPEGVQTGDKIDHACHVSNLDEEVVLIVNSLSNKQSAEIIGVATPNSDSKPAPLKRMLSDPSDVESTPKKVRRFKLMETDLSNSQEIKTSVSRKSLYTDSPSGSEPENEVHEENTPISFRLKRRGKKEDETKNKSLPPKSRKRSKKITHTREEVKKVNSKALDDKIISNVNEAILSTSNEILGNAEKTNRSRRHMNRNENNNSEKTSNTPTKEAKRRNIKIKGDLKVAEDSPPEPAVRRSKRNKATKSKNEDQTGDKIEHACHVSNLDEEVVLIVNSLSNKQSAEIIGVATPNSDSKPAPLKRMLSDPSDVESTLKKVRRFKLMETDLSNSQEIKTSVSRKSLYTDSPSGSEPENEVHEENTPISFRLKRRGKKEDETNNKSLPPKSRKRSKKITHTREEVKKVNSKALDDTIISNFNEAILSTSNKILGNAEKTNRSRRHRNRNENNNSEKTSNTPTKEAKPRKIKIKGDLKVAEDSPPEQAVRRSTRNKATKSKNEDTDKKKKYTTVNENAETKPKPKSILKNSKSKDNQSAVYNISSGITLLTLPSESGTDSPKSLKRSAMADLDVPRPKLARDMQTQFVLFTAFPCEEVKLKLESLGAIVVTDVNDCTVVQTKQLKRTCKLLCAVGLGKPIVGLSWVQACADNNVIVDPWLYLLKDEAAEERYQFSLGGTLGGKRNFLKGYNVSCTPSVMPNEAEMKLIVECSGGTWAAKKPQWVCVSCLADKALWDGLRQQGAIIVTTEFILSGVLRQRADVKENSFDGY